MQGNGYRFPYIETFSQEWSNPHIKFQTKKNQNMKARKKISQKKKKKNKI